MKSKVVIKPTEDMDKYHYNVYMGGVFPASAVSDIPKGQTLMSDSLPALKRALRARKVDMAAIQSVIDVEWCYKGVLTGDYWYRPRYK